MRCTTSSRHNFQHLPFGPFLVAGSYYGLLLILTPAARVALSGRDARFLPGKNAILPRTTAGSGHDFTLTTKLCSDDQPARLVPSCLISSSCPSAHGFIPCFLPTLSHPHAVLCRFLSLAVASSRETFTSRPRPCWAHIPLAVNDEDSYCG